MLCTLDGEHPLIADAPTAVQQHMVPNPALITNAVWHLRGPTSDALHLHACPTTLAPYRINQAGPADVCWIQLAPGPPRLRPAGLLRGTPCRPQLPCGCVRMVCVCVVQRSGQGAAGPAHTVSTGGRRVSAAHGSMLVLRTQLSGCPGEFLCTCTKHDLTQSLRVGVGWWGPECVR